MSRLQLPDRSLIPHLGDYDLDNLSRLIYNPVSGIVYRRRLQMVLDALGKTGQCEKLLEVGYGAGLFLPSLADFCPDIDAIDLHDRSGPVQTFLNGIGLNQVRLRQGSVLDLPYPDATFTHAVCISVLEHIRELDVASREFARVTRPGGWVVLGIPMKNPITKALFRIIGYNDEEIHPSSHDDIVGAASEELRFVGSQQFPSFLPRALGLYMVAWFQRV